MQTPFVDTFLAGDLQQGCTREVQSLGQQRETKALLLLKDTALLNVISIQK